MVCDDQIEKVVKQPVERPADLGEDGLHHLDHRKQHKLSRNVSQLPHEQV